jgi:TolA-binding protein
LEQFPDSPLADWAHHLMGEVYWKMFNYDKAINHYQQVLDNHPDFVHASEDQCRIADVYDFMEMDGIIDKAEADLHKAATYEKLLKNYPDSEQVDNVRQWLSHYKTKNNSSNEGE